MSLFDDIGNGVSDLGKNIADGAANVWKGVGEGVHLTLDVAGFVPVVGAVADGANAGIYALEGNMAMAGLSAACAIPFAGDAVAAVKVGGKALAKGSEAIAKSTSKLALESGADVASSTMKKSISGVKEFNSAVRAEQQNFSKLGKFFSTGTSMGSKGANVARGMFRLAPITSVFMGKNVMSGFESAYAETTGDNMNNVELEGLEDNTEAQYLEQLNSMSEEELKEYGLTTVDVEYINNGGFDENSSQLVEGQSVVTEDKNEYETQVSTMIDDMANQFGINANEGVMSSLKSVIVPLGAGLMQLFDKVKTSLGFDSQENVLQEENESSGLSFDPDPIGSELAERQKRLRSDESREELRKLGTVMSVDNSVEREVVDESLLPRENVADNNFEMER